MNPTYPLTLTTVTADNLLHETHEEIIDLCTRAFGEDFRSIIDTFNDETHVLGYVDGCLVTHGLWVTRYLQVDDGVPLRTAYVEGVATDEAFRQRGYAQAVMERIAIEVQEYELAGLSPFSVSYYGRLGWEKWTGPLFIRTAEGLERSPEDEVVMILRLRNTPEFDLSQSLSAEWRKGELW